MTPEFKRKLGTQRAKVSHIIRYEMRIRGYSGCSLAKAIGCSDVLVSQTTSGKAHSPLVLDALHDLGIPEELLFDPRRAVVPALNVKRKRSL